MEADNFWTISRQEDFIRWLQGEIPIWNAEFALSLNSTDNNMGEMLPELREIHLAEMTFWLDFKLHQGYSAIGKMLQWQSIRKINNIGNITSS